MNPSSETKNSDHQNDIPARGTQLRVGYPFQDHFTEPVAADGGDYHQRIYNHGNVHGDGDEESVIDQLGDMTQRLSYRFGA